MCAEAGPEGGEACSVKVRQTNPKKCPVCRIALARTPIRALSAEQGIAVLPATCKHCFTASTRGHEARCLREHFAEVKAAKEAGVAPGVDFYEAHKYEEGIGMGGLYIVQ